jgi:molybdenum cofactor biosynthesis protein B
MRPVVVNNVPMTGRSDSVSQHRATAPVCVRCFVLTVSDTRTLGTDTSGQAIAALLEEAGHALTGRETVRDEPTDVLRIIRRELDRRDAGVLITTGGTGITSRDSTYEAVTALFDKTIVGFGELFRALSFAEIGAAAMLSRATAGVISRPANNDGAHRTIMQRAAVAVERERTAPSTEPFAAPAGASSASPEAEPSASGSTSTRCAIFVLPGSEHAVRLAMTRLIIPELGHLARELAR